MKPQIQEPKHSGKAKRANYLMIYRDSKDGENHLLSRRLATHEEYVKERQEYKNPRSEKSLVISKFRVSTRDEIEALIWFAKPSKERNQGLHQLVNYLKPVDR